MSSRVALQVRRLQAHRHGAGCLELVTRTILLLYPVATRDRLALRTTGMQTYTEQQSDSHQPVEARLRR
jgi:hypothetical protein